MGLKKMKKTTQSTLQISGMTCASCANRIEKGLNKVEGVSKANVNFALETASVEYSPSEVGLADMVTKIEKLGFKARAKEDRNEEDETRQQAEIDQQKGKFILLLSSLSHYFGPW